MKTTPIFGLLSMTVISTVTVITPAMAANMTTSMEIDLTTGETFGDVAVSSTKVELSNNALLDDDLSLGASNGEFNFSNTSAGLVGFPPFLEDFLGIDPVVLDLDGIAYEGSAFKKNIAVKKGDKLSFDWNFFSNETFPLAANYLDYAFLLVNDELVKLADVNDAGNNSSFFDSETGVQSYEYVFANSGVRTVALGVVDIDDFIVTSALEVSNVTLTTDNTTIPEPFSLLSLLFCTWLGTKTRSNKSRKQK